MFKNVFGPRIITNCSFLSARFLILIAIINFLRVNFLDDLRNSPFVFLINTYNQLGIRIRENVCLSSEFVELAEQDARGTGNRDERDRRRWRRTRVSHRTRKRTSRFFEKQPVESVVERRAPVGGGGGGGGGGRRRRRRRRMEHKQTILLAPALSNSSCWRTGNSEAIWTGPGFGELLRATLILVLSLGILFANLLVICVINSRRYSKYIHAQPRYLLTSLASNDLAIGLLVTPFGFLPAVYGCWPYGEVVCQIQALLRGALTQQSAVILVCMAIDRYVCMLHPHRYHRHSSKKLRIANEENAQEDYYSFGRHLAIIHEFVTILRKQPGNFGANRHSSRLAESLFLSTCFSTYLRDPSLKILHAAGLRGSDVDHLDSKPGDFRRFGSPKGWLLLQWLRPSRLILACCCFYFPTTMVLMYCYGSAFHVNKLRLKRVVCVNTPEIVSGGHIERNLTSPFIVSGSSRTQASEYVRKHTTSFHIPLPSSPLPSPRAVPARKQHAIQDVRPRFHSKQYFSLPACSGEGKYTDETLRCLTFFSSFKESSLRSINKSDFSFMALRVGTVMASNYISRKDEFYSEKINYVHLFSIFCFNYKLILLEVRAVSYRDHSFIIL
ncbi:trace amine-associated receptor 9 isoform X1 [Vespula squamosa]|uniref:Trace amine-associated receptor 9 isoform X1 n=1 Tax=Vespula squamosa TaxID=30214 RepID=A0ABD2B2N3_VESSQ